jgi:hydrogenase maturation protein HypF
VTEARIVDRKGRELAGPYGWPEVAATLLRSGQILAVKGAGGFHLVCDAAAGSAVALLRERKGSPCRPFALMARDLQTVRRFCAVGAEEEQLLTSPAAPIVLLKRLPDGPAPGQRVAPGLGTLGVMLPDTQLHRLLMAAGPAVLAITSGNPTGLPPCSDEEDARQRLGHIADAFLTHSEPIETACDDSVVQVAGGAPTFLRRSRGYVPRPVPVAGGPGGSAPAALGAGGDRSNTFCLLDGARAVFSQHLGDMEGEVAQANWRRALEHLRKLSGIRPTVVGLDMHPRSHSAAVARTLGLPTVPVQHHHAHLAACMAENGLEGGAIGLVLDGAGYGPDGAIWGFEVLAGDYAGFRRIGHLAYSPLPGGEAATRRPLMAAAGMLCTHLGVILGDAPEVQLAVGLMRGGVNCPQVGSAGGLFDTAAAMLGICRLQTYEGQAAAELEAAARPSVSAYPFAWIGDALSPAGILEGVLGDLHRPALAAGRFLATVAEMARAGARRARLETGLTAVCLSGATWNSAWLLERVTALLESDGFDVYRHRQVPAGDGGLALGQAMVARLVPLKDLPHMMETSGGESNVRM